MTHEQESARLLAAIEAELRVLVPWLAARGDVAAGFVYVARCNGCGLVKMGFTGGNVRDRAYKLRCPRGCAGRVAVVHSVAGSRALEGGLHRAFEYLRYLEPRMVVNGSFTDGQREWFDFSLEPGP